MAVNLTLGFQDQYSAGFQQLTAEMEKQEQAARDLASATQQHNNALKRMSREHNDAVRAMAGAKEASGSLTIPMKRLSEETKKAAISSEQMRQAMGNIAGPLAGLPPKVLLAVAAWKGLQAVYKGLTSNQAVNDHIKNTTKDFLGLDPVIKQINIEWKAGVERTRALRDSMLGMSTESRKLTGELQRQADGWKHLKQLRGNYEQEKKAERELAELAKIRTKEEADNAVRAQQEVVARVNTSKKATEEAKQAENAKLIALEKHRDKVIADLAAQREAERKQAIERETELRKQAAERELQMQREQYEEERKMREEAAEHERRIREARAEGERSLMDDLERQDRDFWRQRLTAKEGNEERLVELEKETAKRRHEIALKGATDEEEIIRANYALERELREIDHNHEMALEAKKIDAARKAAEAKVQAEKEKIEKIKALTDSEGKNLFQQQMGKQGPQQVVEELARRRFEAAQKERPNMSQEAQLRLMRGLRMQTARDLQSGLIDANQVARVQSDLASKNILAGAKQGKVTQDMIRVLADQAKTVQDQINFNEEMSQRLANLEGAAKSQQQTTQQQAQRLRAQRRAIRG